jgi:hypothetical protein
VSTACVPAGISAGRGGHGGVKWERGARGCPVKVGNCGAVSVEGTLSEDAET